MYRIKDKKQSHNFFCNFYLNFSLKQTITTNIWFITKDEFSSLAMTQVNIKQSTFLINNLKIFDLISIN